jgi:hypothetical protein
LAPTSTRQVCGPLFVPARAAGANPTTPTNAASVTLGSYESSHRSTSFWSSERSFLKTRRPAAAGRGASDGHDAGQRKLGGVVHAADHGLLGSLEQAQAPALFWYEDALHVADLAAALGLPAHRLSGGLVGAGQMIWCQAAQVVLDHEQP